MLSIGYVSLATSCVQRFPDDTLLLNNVLSTLEALLADSTAARRPPR